MHKVCLPSAFPWSFLGQGVLCDQSHNCCITEDLADAFIKVGPFEERKK